MTRPDVNKFIFASLLESPVAAIRDVCCSGGCRHKSTVECATALHLVFPYRGAFIRHVGTKNTVAEANQVVFFNEDEDYSISHPLAGGDGCLSITIDPMLIRELAAPGELAPGAATRFHRPSRRLEPGAQIVAAQLRHGLARGALDTLAAEMLLIKLAQRAIGEGSAPACAITYGRQKLADRAKLVLAAEPDRRWTLTSIAHEVGVSPVYLTQIFACAEGMSLYRYQTHLRLARAMERLGECRDLTALALDLGFSSHSHFTAAFRKLYGQSPSAFQRSIGLR